MKRKDPPVKIKARKITLTNFGREGSEKLRDLAVKRNREEENEKKRERRE